MSLFMLRGTGAAFYAPAVASDNGPTETELGASLNFSRAFHAIQGLEPQQNPINTPVLEHATEVQIEGPETFSNVVITIVEDDGTGTDEDALVRQECLETMDKGASGALVLSRVKKNPGSGDTVYMIRGSFGRQTPLWDIGAEAAKTNLNFFPTSPLEKVKILPGA